MSGQHRKPSGCWDVAAAFAVVGIGALYLAGQLIRAIVS